MYCSQILSDEQFKEVINAVKFEKPKMSLLKPLLRLNEEDLNEGNLKEFQKDLWKDFCNNYNGTIIIIRSDFGKNFAFFIPE